MTTGKKRIYMDTAAATPVDKRVERAMRPFFAREFGNPSSLHAEGVVAKKALDSARAKVAEIIGAHPDEIIFTSGGTEANNLALQGIVQHSVLNMNNLITTAIEHSSVLEPARKLGAVVVEPDDEGIIAPEKIKQALAPETKLVSVIYANNEIGAIQPIRAISKVIREFKKAKSQKLIADSLYLHIDACQAGRFLDLNVARLGVDLMTLNGGKIYGPKGVGVLYVRRGVKLDPNLLGGGQEAGRRSGTENLPGIVGFTEALSLSAKLRERESAKLAKLRDQLGRGLLALSGAELNGPSLAREERLRRVRQSADLRRLPNNLNISFAGLEAEQLVIELDARGIAVSSGSACEAAQGKGSHVILALGKGASAAAGSLRFSLGRETSAADIAYVLKAVQEIINKLNHARNTLAKI